MNVGNLNNFIEKYINKFGEKYTFEKSIYINSHTKMIVTCRIHGDFEIRPCDLLNGYGCPYCGGSKKNNTNDFVKKAKYVHNNYFTYNKSIYLNSNNKIIVTCPIHGDFYVKANNHLNGVNCKGCQLDGLTHKINKLEIINKSTKKLTTKEFIKKAKEKYGNKYFYNKTVYVKNNLKVIIICPIHGEFEITPNHFLCGRGCPFCGRNKRKTTESFISEVKEKQPYADYDYSKVKYINIHTPITLICNTCGCEFNNQPSNILKYKQGCPRCNESHLENEIRFFIEEKNIEFTQWKKFDFLGKQSLDFYLPKYNVAIECQGEQHFIPKNFFGGAEGFKIQQERDLKKQILCKENNIVLLYYASEKFKNIKNIITNKNNLLKIITNDKN